MHALPDELPLALALLLLLRLFLLLMLLLEPHCRVCGIEGGRGAVIIHVHGPLSLTLFGSRLVGIEVSLIPGQRCWMVDLLELDLQYVRVCGCRQVWMRHMWMRHACVLADVEGGCACTQGRAGREGEGEASC